MNSKKASFQIPPSVIFSSLNYRHYISSASQLNKLNIQSVELFEVTDGNVEYLLSRALILSRDLMNSYDLFSELMNVNCEHGFYRPSLVDILRLLSWQETSKHLQRRVIHKLFSFG